MTNLYIIAAVLSIIGVAVLLVKIFKKEIIRFLFKIKTKYSLGTLREAIHEADNDKKKTGRKNMVIYNSTTKTFEPVQKKLLKQVANHNKRKKIKSDININRIKQIEKKSLYVTR